MCYFCTLKYELPPASAMQLQQKVRKEDDFRENFRVCWNDTFYRDIDYRICHNMNVILSILGLPGSGKSNHRAVVTYLLDKNGNFSRMTMGEFFELPTEQQKEFSTFTLNEESKKLVLNKVLECNCTGQGEIYEVITRTGRKIKTTFNHKYLTLNENGLEWKPLCDLKKGIKIAVPRQIEFEGNDFNIDEAKLLGYLISDGSLSGLGISLTLGKTKIGAASDFINSFKNIFNIEPNQNEFENYLEINKQSPEITAWLKKYELLGKRSHTKRVPKEIFVAKKDAVAAFLNAIFSCDGTLSYQEHPTKAGNIKHQIQIEYYSVSEGLIRDIQTLLLRFGINARVLVKNGRYKGQPHYSWRLTFSGKRDCLNFLKNIGMKCEGIEEIMKEAEALDSNTNIDTFPIETWKLVGTEMKKCKIITRANANDKRPMGWKTLGKELGYTRFTDKNGYAHYNTPNRLRHPSRDQIEKIAKIIDSDILKSLADSDIYWDEITSIESTGKTEPVYDLTIENNHNFVANDIIIHNSHAGIYVAKYIGSKTGVGFPNDASNIVFTYQEFLNAVKASKPKDTFVQDEQRVLGVGLGSRSLAEEIQDIERIVRKRQNNMIYIAPTLESHLHIGILEPLGINYEHKIARLMFYDNKQVSHGKIYTRDPNMELLNFYEDKKSKFIEKIVNRSMGDTLEEIEKMLANLKTDEEFARLSNKPKRIFHIAKKYPTLPYQMQELVAELATEG